MLKDPLFLWNHAVYIIHIQTYYTLKVCVILKICFSSSMQNFLINIFYFSLAILKKIFGYYEIKGMLRRNIIEHFPKKHYMKNQEFLKWNNEKKFFSVSNGLYFLHSVKIWTPVFTFCFWLINLWRNNEHIFWELSETCY